MKVKAKADPKEEIIKSEAEGGEYLLSSDVIDEQVGKKCISKPCVSVFFRKNGIDDWEPVKTLKTWKEAKLFVRREKKRATEEKQVLTYDGQIDFEKWALRMLGTKKDLFYFDYVTGVDAKTSKDIRGLVADGSMTWGAALEVVRKHFFGKI